MSTSTNTLRLLSQYKIRLKELNKHKKDLLKRKFNRYHKLVHVIASILYKDYKVKKVYLI